MRYVRQPDKYSCGPTAIINAVKWAGKKMSLSNHKKLVKECHTTYEMGTHEIDFSASLKKNLKKIASIKFRKKALYKDVISHLNNDSAIILLYWKKMQGYTKKNQNIEAHYTLVFLNENKETVYINDSLELTSMILPKSTLRKRLIFMKNDKVNFPCVWFIKKNKRK